MTTTTMRARMLYAALGAFPVLLLAHSTAPFIKYAGAPADGGATCVACHQNSAAGLGSVAVDIASYTPGQTQTLHVTVSDPSASRWGFQMTARALNSPSGEAGTFTPIDTNVRVQCDDGSATGSPGPCNGLREYAEHVAAPSTAAGAGLHL